MEGKVDVIALNGTRYGVATPEGELRIGDEFSKVLALPGVRSEWQDWMTTAYGGGHGKASGSVLTRRGCRKAFRRRYAIQNDLPWPPTSQA